MSKVAPLFSTSLYNEWDQVKNDPARLDDYSKGSGKKVWWRCSEGHSWDAAIKTRVKGSRCPYCANQLVLTGYNDLLTKYPKIAIQFDLEKNKPLVPQSLLPGSHKKVWWKCSEGHSWNAEVTSRTRLNSGCPYCKGKKVISGLNDLATVNPELSKELDAEKNYPQTANDIMCHSNKKVWWKCSEGHSWESTPNNRSKGKGCPVCKGKKVLQGFNDLSTVRPDLADQFDLTKNSTSPCSITKAAKGCFWWKCENGHSWQAPLYHRSKEVEKGPTGCPVCASKTFSSRGEKDLLTFVQTLCPLAVGTYKNLPNIHEVDIFIPNKRIAIEYNGLYYHSDKFKSKNYHYNKWLECKNQGIQLIQIWEDEWADREAVVKSMLAHKIGKSFKEKVYARKTTVKETSTKDSSSFLVKNHIQGPASGSIRIGLFYQNDLVALGLFKKRTDTTLELVRYATSCHVIGGQGKILNYLKVAYPQYCKVVTFADHCVSNGGLYEKLGFVNDGLLLPDYKYLVNSRLEHKFNYRIKRFKEDPNLYYEEGLTEHELSKVNGLLRVYDAGKTRYVLYI